MSTPVILGSRQLLVVLEWDWVREWYAYHSKTFDVLSSCRLLATSLLVLVWSLLILCVNYPLSAFLAAVLLEMEICCLLELVGGKQELCLGLCSSYWLSWRVFFCFLSPLLLFLGLSLMKGYFGIIVCNKTELISVKVKQFSRFSMPRSRWYFTL